MGYLTYLIIFLSNHISCLSVVPVTGSRWRAHYKVVEFQPRAEDTRTLDSVLMVSTIYVFLTDDCGPPSLSPTPRFPRPSSMSVATLPVRVSLSLLLLPPLRPFRLEFVVPPRTSFVPRRLPP